MLTHSLVDGTLDEAIEALTKIAAERRTSPTYEKQAFWGQDTLSSIGSYFSGMNPHARNALIGGGVGAIGAGGATAFKNFGKEPGERKSILGSALTGGLAGAAVGGGGSLIHEGLKGLQAPSKPDVAGIAPKRFQHRGQMYDASPEILQQHPELADHVDALSKPTTGDNLWDAGTAGLKKLWSQAPVSLSVLPGVATMDALMESKGLHLGDRNWMHAPSKALSGAGKHLFGDSMLGDWMEEGGKKLNDWGASRNWLGSLDARNSTNPEHLREGFKSDAAKAMGAVPDWVTPAETADVRRQAVEAVGGSDKTIKDLSKTQQGGKATHYGNILREEAQPDAPGPTKEVWRKTPLDENKIDPHTGRPDMRGAQTFLESTENQVIKQPPIQKAHDVPVSYSQDNIRDLRAAGASSAATRAGQPYAETPHVRRNPFGKPQVVPGGALGGAKRIAPRMLLYAGLPAAEAALQQYMSRSNNQNALDEQVQNLIRQRLIAPVPPQGGN